MDKLGDFSWLNVPLPDGKSGVVDPNAVLQYLTERGRSGKLVIMTGAGVSASAGLALWSEMGEVLKKILNKSDDEWDNVSELAQIYVEQLEKQLRRPGAARVKLILLINYILRFSKGPKKRGYFGQIYPRLERLPVFNFYTTNWDGLLPECLQYLADKNAFSNIRRLDNQMALYESDISHGKTRDVIYLHGTLQGPHDQLIITSDDCKLFEKKAEHVFKRLLRQFEEETTMLCVGYSFSDLHVAEYIQKALVRGHPDSNVYALFAKIEPKDARKLWRFRGIYPVSVTAQPALIEEAVCLFMDLLIDAIGGKPVNYIPPEGKIQISA